MSESRHEAMQKETLVEVLRRSGSRTMSLERLEADIAAVPADATAAMDYCHETLVPGLASARRAADALEALLPKEAWPFPVYGDILFY